MNNEQIEQAIDGLKLQRFWPHVDDIVIDAGRALDVIEELLTNIIELEQRNQALEMTLDRITEKENWEILIDMQRDQLKVRKAFKKVIKQLDDLVKDSA
jgi:hypoxanthine phosphoribosyltransferase